MGRLTGFSTAAGFDFGGRRCKEPPNGGSLRECMCKPDSVSAYSRRLRADDDHLSGPDIAERARAAYLGLMGGQPSPCLALLPVGFTEPTRSPGTLVVSYTTVSPLPD